jgi:hypothetical protein
VIATEILRVDTILFKRLYVLVSIERGTRRIQLAEITANPDGPWTTQQARNLAMTLGERLGGDAVSDTRPRPVHRRVRRGVRGLRAADPS